MAGAGGGGSELREVAGEQAIWGLVSHKTAMIEVGSGRT